jgi:hypothetical protein
MVAEQTAERSHRTNEGAGTMATLRRVDLNGIALWMAGALCGALLMAGVNVVRPAIHDSAPIVSVAVPQDVSSGPGIVQDERFAGQFREQNLDLPMSAVASTSTDTMSRAQGELLEQNLYLPGGNGVNHQLAGPDHKTGEKPF